MHENLCGARLGVAAALAASCGSAAGIELSEQEAVARALGRPAFVEVETARLAVARGGVTEAGRLPNPVAAIEYERMPAPGGRSVERAFSIKQSLDISGRRSLRVQAAEQRVEAARHDARERRLQAAAEVRRAFAESLHRERQQQVLAAWVKRIEAASETVARLAKAGETSGYARRRIAREAQAARGRLAAAAGDAMRAYERLRGLAALDSREELKLAGMLVPDALPPLDRARALLRQRPDLAGLIAQAEAFERERSLAELAWAPDVTLGVGQKRVEEPIRSDTGLVLSLAIPLPLFDRGEGRRDTAAAQARALRAEHALTLARLEAEVKGLWHQANELRTGAVALRVAPVSDLSRIAETAYRAGEGGIVDLVDAYRAELESDLGTLDLELRARLARVELDAFVGTDHAR